MAMGLGVSIIDGRWGGEFKKFSVKAWVSAGITRLLECGTLMSKKVRSPSQALSST